MPLKIERPKYAVLADAVEQRINSGVYPPGTAIPSESQLSTEFKMSRPTVVRALNILVRDGLLDPQIGIGRIVRSPQERGVHNLGELADKLRAAGWTVVDPDGSSDLLERLTDAMYVASTGGCDHSAQTCEACLGAAALQVFARLGPEPD